MTSVGVVEALDEEEVAAVVVVTCAWPLLLLAVLLLLMDEETVGHVGLMGLPVDAYALNAILRLLLRLTRTFDYAVIFAQMGGVKMLLDLTQASSFSGIILHMDFL